MKKALAICILCLILLSCAYAEVLTVGTDLSAEEIRDFYYTYDWVGYNAEYHRYRFFTENGKYFFFHHSHWISPLLRKIKKETAIPICRQWRPPQKRGDGYLPIVVTERRHGRYVRAIYPDLYRPLLNSGCILYGLVPFCQPKFDPFRHFWRYQCF